MPSVYKLNLSSLAWRNKSEVFVDVNFLRGISFKKLQALWHNDWIFNNLTPKDLDSLFAVSSY